MPKDFEKEQSRTGIFLAIGFVFLIWIVLSEKMFFEAFIYGIFGIITILGLWSFKRFWKNSPSKKSVANAYYGVGKSWKIGLLVGILASVGFLLLTRIKIFNSVAQLITPTVPLGVMGAGIVVILLAPIFEESGMTGTMLSFFNLYMPFWLSALFKAILFSGIHYYAYVIIAGSTLTYALGAFIGAGIFGFMTAYLAKWRGLESAIIAHLVFNAVSFATTYQLFSIVG